MASRLSAQKIGFKNTKGFTLLELMVVVTILGILAATATSAFRNYILRSKTTEAVQGVSKMVEGEVQYHAKTSTFVSAGPVNIPPSVNKQTGDFTTDPNWVLINFSYGDQIQYGYQATVTDPTTVECEAQGDLNGDTITSIFRRTVTANPAINISQLAIFGELD